MTTIAWKGGVLVADKKASEDETGYRCTKLFRTRTHAFAFAGNQSTGLKFKKWFPKQKGRCPLDKDTTVLVMDLETGKCEQWDDGGEPIPIEDRFAAIGSGAPFAIGAMANGASAIEAVEISNEWDNSSGLGINYAKSRRTRAFEQSLRRTRVGLPTA